MAEIFERYANVTTIDLTVKPRLEKSAGQQDTIQKIEAPEKSQ